MHSKAITENKNENKHTKSLHIYSQMQPVGLNTEQNYKLKRKLRVMNYNFVVVYAFKAQCLHE